ncbi:hypothetical protein ACFSBS_08855 [Azospirillum griseum]
MAAMVMLMTAQQVQAETKAAAQGQAQAGQAPSGKSDKPRVMAGSPLTQIPFAIPAFPLTDDGTYRAYLNKIAADDNRQCGKQEQFGWEFEKGSQATLDSLFSAAQSALAKNGYKITASTSAAIADKETVAQFADKSKRNILLVWVPMQDAALLMLCETASTKKPK